MEKSLTNCPKCKLEVLNEDYRFCVKCGKDLGRGGIKVDCCNRYVLDPWVIKNGYVLFCPYCGEMTGQKSPREKAAIKAKMEKDWEDGEKQRQRVLNPPLLSNATVRVKALDGADVGKAVAADVLNELRGYDNRAVVVAENLTGIKELFKAFEGHVQRSPITAPQLIIDEHVEEKKANINDKFERGQPIFTTAEILAGLRLRYANRFFLVLPVVSDEFLKTIGRLASPVNKSKKPIIYDYLEQGKGERIRCYEKEEALVEGGKGND